MKFFNFFSVYEITTFKKKSCYKIISKIRNLTLIFQNFQQRKKVEKIRVDLKKSINSFES